MKQFQTLLIVAVLASDGYAQTVVNTLTQRQITRLTEQHVNGQDWQHVISDNGNRAVWYRQTNPKRVYVVGTDGSGLDSIVDVGSGRLSQVDISADGSKVVYIGDASGHKANFVNADGSGNTSLLELNTLHMHTLKIAGDGSRAFFGVYSNTSIAGGGAIERGVYAIDLDGSNLVQIAGPASVATALGIDIADVGVFYGGSSGASIDVSYDGNEVVFMAKNNADNRYYVFTAHNGVTKVMGPYSYLNAVGISADGSTIAASVNNDGNHEGWVADYSGSGLQMLASNADMFYFSNGNGQGDAVSLNSDGSKVLFDAFGHIFNSDGSGVLSLAAATVGSAGWPMIGDAIERPTMTSDGSRFLFSFADYSTGLYQLAVLDINPATMGNSPALSDFYWAPDGAEPGGQASELRVRVTPSAGADSIWYVGNVALLNSIKDINVAAHTFSDDGVSNGDQTANDQIYTHWNVYAFSNAEIGPRTMRFNCETYSPDLMHYGTSVDVNTWHVGPNVGVSSVEEPRFSMYPNPASGMALIDFSPHDFDISNLTVTDVSGRRIATHPFVLDGRPMLNTSNWSDGLYCVSLVDRQGNRYVVKLMVQH